MAKSSQVGVDDESTRAATAPAVDFDFSYQESQFDDDNTALSQSKPSSPSSSVTTIMYSNFQQQQERESFISRYWMGGVHNKAMAAWQEQKKSWNADEVPPIGVLGSQEPIKHQLEGCVFTRVGRFGAVAGCFSCVSYLMDFSKCADCIMHIAVLYFGVPFNLRSSVAVLLEEIPPQIDWMKVYEAISAVPDIHDVHDLHIWCISHGEPSLSVHCVSQRLDLDEALKDIYGVCQQFGISHATIQLQHSRTQCITCQGQCFVSSPSLNS